MTNYTGTFDDVNSKNNKHVKNEKEQLPVYRWFTCNGCDVTVKQQNYTKFQTLKVIQNTVRVPSSLYTMNLGAVSTYKKQTNATGVNWNQMSDKPQMSYQQTYVPSHGNSTKSTITRERPGAQSPGGKGCDVKHNSYDRYLNKLKGAGVLRGEISPEHYTMSGITFNRSKPVYGGKTMTTSIIPNCYCKISVN